MELAGRRRGPARLQRWSRSLCGRAASWSRRRARIRPRRARTRGRRRDLRRIRPDERSHDHDRDRRRPQGVAHPSRDAPRQAWRSRRRGRCDRRGRSLRHPRARRAVRPPRHPRGGRRDLCRSSLAPPSPDGTFSATTADFGARAAAGISSDARSRSCSGPEPCSRTEPRSRSSGSGCARTATGHGARGRERADATRAHDCSARGRRSLAVRSLGFERVTVESAGQRPAREAIADERTFVAIRTACACTDRGGHAVACLIGPRVDDGGGDRTARGPGPRPRRARPRFRVAFESPGITRRDHTNGLCELARPISPRACRAPLPAAPARARRRRPDAPRRPACDRRSRGRCAAGGLETTPYHWPP